MVPVRGRPLPRRSVRRRDGQQWILDWIVKTTRRVQNFERDEALVPEGVKSYRMIAKLQGEQADHQFALAEAAERHGARKTAGELFYRAAQTYLQAQHAIFEDDNPRRATLHGRLIEAYHRFIPTADYPIERIEVPFRGTTLQGLLPPAARPAEGSLRDLRARHGSHQGVLPGSLQ